MRRDLSQGKYKIDFKAAEEFDISLRLLGPNIFIGLRNFEKIGHFQGFIGHFYAFIGYYKRTKNNFCATRKRDCARFFYMPDKNKLLPFFRKYHTKYRRIG